MTHLTSLFLSSNFHNHLTIFPHLLCLPSNDIKWNCKRLQKYLGIRPSPYSTPRLVSGKQKYILSIWHASVVERKCDTSDDIHVNVQTLRKFPVEKLYGEHAILRIDSSLLLEQSHVNSSASSAISTIRYLHDAGAKILLLSNWGEYEDSNHVSTKYFSDSLSRLLGIEVKPAKTEYSFVQLKATDFKTSDILLFDNLGMIKEEFTNCSYFSEKISSGAYIFVNDAFLLSRKVLASTVGISRFCDVSVAGFHFEEELLLLSKVKETTRKPYIAIFRLGAVSSLKRLVLCIF